MEIKVSFNLYDFDRVSLLANTLARVITSFVTGALSILSALQGNTTIQSIVLEGNAIKYDLLTQITTLAARNTHQDSTMQEAFTKNNHPIKPRNVSNARERGSSKSKTTLDDDHALTNDHSISSISTLETIMEESESEDDDDSVF